MSTQRQFAHSEVETMLKTLGVTLEEARDALRTYREQRPTKGRAELRIPVNRSLGLYLFGLRVVIDPNVDAPTVVKT
jgi:hypothetical protein